MDRVFDLAIIGGGINGCGIARDAAGRGNSVFLCEMNDLASGTSSWSTKLVHGGLRYLEYYEFRLVREALIEREVLLRNAPHIIWPMRFVLPAEPGLRLVRREWPTDVGPVDLIINFVKCYHTEAAVRADAGECPPDCCLVCGIGE